MLLYFDYAYFGFFFGSCLSINVFSSCYVLCLIMCCLVSFVLLYLILWHFKSCCLVFFYIIVFRVMLFYIDMSRSI